MKLYILSLLIPSLSFAQIVLDEDYFRELPDSTVLQMCDTALFNNITETNGATLDFSNYDFSSPSLWLVRGTPDITGDILTQNGHNLDELTLHINSQSMVERVFVRYATEKRFTYNDDKKLLTFPYSQGSYFSDSFQGVSSHIDAHSGNPTFTSGTIEAWGVSDGYFKWSSSDSIECLLVKTVVTRHDSTNLYPPPLALDQVIDATQIIYDIYTPLTQGTWTLRLSRDRKLINNNILTYAHEGFVATTSSPITSVSGSKMVSSDFLMYPNPSQGKIAVRLGQGSIGDLIVRNAQGVVVHTTKLQNKQVIDLGHLQSGTYFVSIMGNNNQMARCLFIE